MGESKDVGVTVRVPPYWRQYTNRQADVVARGGTVREVLEDLCRQFPPLRSRLFTDDGRLATNVSVFLNREAVRRREGECTPVAPGDRIMVILAIAGG